MSRMTKPVFNEKHLKALALIEKGGMSLGSVAKVVGWKEDYLYDLYEGDTIKAGSVASLFSAECRKVDKKRTQLIKDLTKSNKALANELIHEVLKNIKSRKFVSKDDKKLIATMMNCLNKSTPSVEVGSVSYSYTKGYTPEQLIYEFRRLQSLAGGSSNRGAVQESVAGRAGALLELAGSGDEVEEDEPSPPLQAST